jgi:hypothetical protein
MTKSEKFNKAIKKIVEDKGAKKISHNKWEIDTKHGKLNISLHEPEKRQKLFSVFTRFEEPERAKQHTHCNPHSGKWNFHIIDMDECINIFQSSLNKVLCEKETTCINIS